MYPQACYLRWLTAVEGGEVDEALEARADLCQWLAVGGVAPEWTDTERKAFFGWDHRKPLALPGVTTEAVRS